MIGTSCANVQQLLRYIPVRGDLTRGFPSPSKEVVSGFYGPFSGSPNGLTKEPAKPVLETGDAQRVAIPNIDKIDGVLFA